MAKKGINSFQAGDLAHIHDINEWAATVDFLDKWGDGFMFFSEHFKECCFNSDGATLDVIKHLPNFLL